MMHLLALERRRLRFYLNEDEKQQRQMQFKLHYVDCGYIVVVLYQSGICSVHFFN